ncbi:MAG: ATP-dependent DNA helicase [Spirochaetales bacterium]|nr:ATP-dependent DNA helicase [Spirochaetales bacterium]
MGAQPDSASLSVHRFIELTAREGDMHGGFFSNQRAVDGTKAHKKVQASRPTRYEKERKVERQFTKNDHTLCLEGRIDGIFLTEPLEFEEIKTVERDFPGSWEESPLLHRAQLLVYGGLYRVEPEESLKLTLTYYHLRSEKEERYSRTMTGSELSVYLDGLLDKYFARKAWQRQWQEQRNKTCRELTFPYGDFRPGQRDLSARVYRAVRDECLLMVQAPTGTGKTMGTLFPAVKALGEGHADRIIYLTARTTGRALAAEGARDLEKGGARLITVILTGKEKICREPEARQCDPAYCPYAEGYYDKLELIRGRLEEIAFFDREVFNGLADEYGICPFELSLDLGLEADILAADFNHLFDPVVSLKRYFARPNERYTVLIDEAHNLPDRGRDMYTARLEKETILELKRGLKKLHPALEKSPLLRSLEGLNRCLLDFRKQWEALGEKPIVLSEPDKNLLDRIARFNQLAESVLREDLPPDAHALLMGFYLNTRFYTKIAELFGPAYRFVLEGRGRKDCEATLLCLHPAPLLKEGFEKSASAILFSATLSPPDYFRTILLDTDREVREAALPSPFDPRNCPIYLAGRINTRYRGRDASLPQLIEAIAHGRRLCPGNHLVFFPSYRYLTSAQELWEKTYTDEDLLIQTGAMKEEEREEFLNRFARARDEGRSLLAFAVMGGIFGEGIDLPGDLLTGVTIVGPGIPGIGTERDLLKEYYEGLGLNGYDFAYRLPGWNRVLQAAGRVIRKETDRGIIQLIDDRFTQGAYRRLFPPHWLIKNL